MVELLVAGLVGLVIAVWYRYQRRARRLREGQAVARELLPEIRAVMDSADPRGPSDGEPLAVRHYEAERQRLPRILSSETLFAVETFYQCVEALRGARRSMREAFSDESEIGLGDRIRAKDRNDRCLKDVYYTGESAIQALERLLA